MRKSKKLYTLRKIFLTYYNPKINENPLKLPHILTIV